VKALQIIIGTLFGSIVIASAARAYVLQGRPNCPDNFAGQPRHTWQDYMLGKYGDGTRAFSIRFDHAKSPVGTLQPNACYTVVHEPGMWSTTGKGDPAPVLTPEAGADPARETMNIRGRIMRFNENGQVFDNEFGYVGTLSCHIGPDC
jgi:hypothetical protein